jgi:hypothetical protein
MQKLITTTIIFLPVMAKNLRQEELKQKGYLRLTTIHQISGSLTQSSWNSVWEVRQIGRWSDKIGRWSDKNCEKFGLNERGGIVNTNKYIYVYI